MQGRPCSGSAFSQKLKHAKQLCHFPTLNSKHLELLTAQPMALEICSHTHCITDHSCSLSLSHILTCSYILAFLTSLFSSLCPFSLLTLLSSNSRIPHGFHLSFHWLLPAWHKFLFTFLFCSPSNTVIAPQQLFTTIFKGQTLIISVKFQKF